MKRRRYRIGTAFLAVAVVAVSLALWWRGGAWENGAMPTDGLVTVLALAGGALAALIAAMLVDRR